MRIIVFLTIYCLAQLTESAPTVDKSDKELIITKDFFTEKLAIYTGEHDIVDILVPLNDLNFEDDDESNIFFVEADIKENGDKDYKGLFVRHNKDVKKLLDNGIAIAASIEDSTNDVFFGAKDGLYKYNLEKQTAEKFGNIEESIIDLAKENRSNILYALTENKEVLKINLDDIDNKIIKLDELKGAKQIVLDYSNNLFLINADNKIILASNDGIKEFTVKNESTSNIRLIRPPMIMDEGIPVIVGDKSCLIYPNGTIEHGVVKMEEKPTACSVEPALVLYFAHDKTIYEYNILTILLGELLEEFKDFLNDMQPAIQEMASMTRNALGA